MFSTILKRCMLVPDCSGMATRKVKATTQMKITICWMSRPVGRWGKRRENKKNR